MTVGYVQTVPKTMVKVNCGPGESSCVRGERVCRGSGGVLMTRTSTRWAKPPRTSLQVQHCRGEGAIEGCNERRGRWWMARRWIQFLASRGEGQQRGAHMQARMVDVSAGTRTARRKKRQRDHSPRSAGRRLRLGHAMQLAESPHASRESHGKQPCKAAAGGWMMLPPTLRPARLLHRAPAGGLHAKTTAALIPTCFIPLGDRRV